MLKTVIGGLGNSIKSVYNVSASPTCVQCVRWRRKPRWIPTAKSKMFRVPERKKEDSEERAELMRLHKNYKTQVRAVRSYLMEEVETKRVTSTADHLVVTPEEELAEFEASVRANDEWNSKIAEERELRLTAQLAERREYIATRLELKDEREREAQLAAEEIVRKEKERSKTYILKENLEQAIEYALANPVDYNFAIDLQENIYTGRTSNKPNSISDGETQALSATVSN